MIDVREIVKAIRGLGDPSTEYEWTPTMSAFDEEQKPKQPQTPVYEPFEPSGWYKAVENARIDASMLAPVGNTEFLMEPHAAQALGAMVSAAAAQGVDLGIGNTYRDYATQAEAYQQYLAGLKEATVAKPGTSNHGWGLAVDFKDMGADSPGYQWLVKNGARFGFAPLAGEPWHWEFGQDGVAPEASLLAQAGTVRHREPSQGPLVTRLLIPAGHAQSNMLANIVTTLHTRETNRKTPRFTGKGASVKTQLRAGFMKAGRPDLAEMVGTRDFSTWITQESGWNVGSVSQYYEGHGRNFGLFQFWDGHPWTEDYYVGGEWTATAFEQAALVARYFPGLTPDDIHRYADDIRAGTYHGWPD